MMLAARITLPHFSVSSAMNLANAAGELANTVEPRSAIRAFIVGSARPTLISRLSLSMISTGVLLGATMPCQPLASKPGTDSATVGTSGNPSQRVAVVTHDPMRESPTRLERLAPAGTDRFIAVLASAAGFLGLSWAGVEATLGRAVRQAEHAMWEAEVVTAIGKAATISPEKPGGQPALLLEDETETAGFPSVTGSRPSR